ncbi:MAG TPA: pyridoxal phosphate-dependent aminotransferase [Bacteroidia bacterium]|nr:pyridoxal phosphate-dependent aminotransferase [Bacteroidia bacterium]
MAIDQHELQLSINLNVRGIGKSATLEINERTKLLEKSGQKIFRMGLGQSPFPVPNQVVDALKLNAHRKDYLDVKGLPELRKAVAGFHEKKDLSFFDPNNILIGPGSKELMFLLMLSFYGEIILPSPSWVSYHPQAKIIGRPVTVIKTTYETKWKITAELLERKIHSQNDLDRPRVIVLNYPANPDGMTYNETELKDLAAVGKKHNIVFLSDEIYGMLHFEGRHLSIARYYPEGTIISSGLSKWCGAGGWRLGTFSFPESLSRLMETMAAVASETFTSVSAPIQYAAVRAFECGINVERYLWRVRKILKALCEKCVEMLRAGNIKVHMPDGAFYLFADFTHYRDVMEARGITGGSEMCKQLLEQTGVAILPGEHFNRPEHELTARLALVNFDGSKALANLETIPLDEPLPENFIEFYCGETVEAIRRIVEWCNN